MPVFLFDVDNTLLDNDRMGHDLDQYLTREMSPEAAAEYWKHYEGIRAEVGYADYLAALNRFRLRHMNEPKVLCISSFLLDYPFAQHLFPGALEVLRACPGPAVILSDGDAVFQPRKIMRSGLWDAVEGRVLIYLHKERMLEQVEQLYPADRYVLVDDKRSILAAVKGQWRERVTTVFPRQGHYAFQKAQLKQPDPDLTVEKLADLLPCDLWTNRV